MATQKRKVASGNERVNGNKPMAQQHHHQQIVTTSNEISHNELNSNLCCKSTFLKAKQREKSRATKYADLLPSPNAQ